MKVVFSRHSLKKLQILEKRGFRLTKSQVLDVISSPDSDVEGKEGRRVCQKLLDEEHVLRVIYEERQNHKRIITVYPGRRDRYEV